MNKRPQDFTRVQQLEISDQQDGQRLDNFLLKTLKPLPKSRVYRIIRKGEVRVNKKRCKPEYKLQVGDIVRIPPVTLDEPENREAHIPQRWLDELERSILFENHSIIVINKPSGLAVHSGSGLAYGVIDIMRKLRHQNDMELVHRLDRDTSGCLILAKSRSGLLEMQSLLKSDEIAKYYTALVYDHWDKSCRQVEIPLNKTTLSNGERRVFADPAGKSALTLIEKIENQMIGEKRLSRLTIRLKTGRTHQIRVHCQSEGHPIIGDDKYGDRERDKVMRRAGLKRLMLHAFRLEIPANAHTKAMQIIAPLPQVFEIKEK